MRIRTQAPRQLVQAGFTLIELIVVIVIIGILAAIAIPKFQDATDAAEKATIKGLAGELAAAGAISYAKVKVEGTGTLPNCGNVISLMSVAPPSGYAVTETTGTTCTLTKGSYSATFSLPN